MSFYILMYTALLHAIYIKFFQNYNNCVLIVFRAYTAGRINSSNPYTMTF